MKPFALRNWALVALLSVFVVACSDNDDAPAPPTPTPTGTPATTVIRSRVNQNLVQYTVKDFGRGTGTVTWSKLENAPAEAGFTANATARVEYVLDGFVFVNSGNTLTIEPGAIVKGRVGQAANASALIVARGATLTANGSATDPIIFTAEGDLLVPVTGAATTYANLTHGNLNTRGQWGGLVILGRASLNRSTVETGIEGIPTTETRGLYGGTTDNDNSGTLRYLSIRHTGTNIGANNELQGLTLGGVGNGTTVEYIESIYSNDDGIEIFGGTVHTKWILVAFADDDQFDWDQGWRGWNQFWLGYHGDDVGNRGGELDGDDSNITPPSISAGGTPFTNPVVLNWTGIGRRSGSESTAMTFRANSGGRIYNAIFEGWNTNAGAQVELRADYTTTAGSTGTLRTCPGLESFCRFSDASGTQLVLQSILFGNVGAGPTVDNTILDVNTTSVPTSCSGCTAPSTSTADGTLRAIYGTGAGTREIVALATVPGISYSATGRTSPATATKLDPAPDASIAGAPAAATTLPTAPAGFTITTANYLGAIDPAAASSAWWIRGWTKLDRAGFLVP